MLTLHVTCDRCGKEAVLKNSEGFFRLNRQKRRLEVIQIVDCPVCGLVEQPEKTPRN